MSSQSPLGYGYSCLFRPGKYLVTTEFRSSSPPQFWLDVLPLERIFTSNLGALRGNHRICLCKSLIPDHLGGVGVQGGGGTQHNLEPPHSSGIIMPVSWGFLLPNPSFRRLRARDLVLSGEFYPALTWPALRGEKQEPLPHSPAFSQQP